MTEIVKFDAATNYAAAPLESRKDYVAQIAAASALLPRAAQNPNWDVQLAQTFYICEVGAMMGIHPLEALAGIHMIEGRWTISSALMSSLVRQAGHKLRVTESGTWKGQDFVATCTIIRHDDADHPTVMTFGYEDAEMAGLLGKGNWAKYGKNMCIARAISKCARAAAEDALGGARYTPEELGANVNDEGEPVDAGHYESTPSQPQQAPASQAAPPSSAAPAAAPVPPATEQPTGAAATTGGAGMRSAADVPDEEIIGATSDAAIVHARSAHQARAKLDIDALAGVFESAKSAKVLREPGIAFDDLGRPSLYGRTDEGGPVQLSVMIRALKAEIVEATAAAEAEAQDASAEQPEQSAYVADSGEPVDAEEVQDEAGDDSAA